MQLFLYFIAVLFAVKVLYIVGLWLTKGVEATLNGRRIPFSIFVIGVVVDSAIAAFAFYFALQL